MTSPLSPEKLIRFVRNGTTLFGVLQTTTMMSEESPIIGDAVLDELNRTGDGLQDVVLDLQGVQTINSATLGMMFTIHATVLQYGFEFHLVNASEFIRSLLTSTKADSVFKVHDSEEDLMAALKA
ncbi:MAG: STAS domain-containing protein [Planctomycetota bacterium]|nr:STAS domain-containing protein [Planctomycetota bacterium]